MCNFGNTVAPQIIKLSTENGKSEEKKTAGNTNLFIELKVIEALIKVLDFSSSSGLIVGSKAATFPAAAAFVARVVEGWAAVAGAAAGVI